MNYFFEQSQDECQLFKRPKIGSNSHIQVDGQIPTKKINNDNTQEIGKNRKISGGSNTNIPQISTKQIDQNKYNPKNKYINRLKQIAPENIKIEQDRSQLLQTLSKRQKGKISVKQCRNRKKLYVQLMQQQQKQLQQQIKKTNIQIDLAKQQLQKVISQNRNTINGLSAGRHQFLKKLENLLNKKSHDINQELNILIDSLGYRIGVNGKQRINSLNQYYKQVINLSLPPLHRYMLWSASQSTQLFSQSDSTQKCQQFDIQYNTLINITDQQKRRIHQMKDKFIINKKLLLELMKNLKDVKNTINQKNRMLQEFMDMVRQILTPVQCAEIILFIQKNQFRKQFMEFQLEMTGKKKIKTQ